MSQKSKICFPQLPQAPKSRNRLFTRPLKSRKCASHSCRKLQKVENVIHATALNTIYASQVLIDTFRHHELHPHTEHVLRTMLWYFDLLVRENPCKLSSGPWAFSAYTFQHLLHFQKMP